LQHNTVLQLDRLFEKVSRNDVEKVRKGTVLLDVPKAFDTVFVGGILCKLSLLNFPSYPVKLNSSFPYGRPFEASFFMTCRPGVGQWGVISPVIFRPYIKEKPTPFHQIQWALYPNDTIIIATPLWGDNP
jgi:hypothetical protein